MSPLRQWIVLRELGDNDRYSAMQVEAETSQQAVELLTRDYPDHMLTRKFAVVPLDEVRMYRAKGETTTTRIVRVEKVRP